jgi:nucleotide-binding universal stress UspA family protein
MPASPSSVTLQRLLVCTDGSPESEGAIKAALDLARTAGSKIYLLEVLTFIPGYELQAPDLLPPPPVNLEVQAAQEAAAQERLQAWKTEAMQQGADLEPRVRRSTSAYEGILEEAEAVAPDWIVMGRHGFTGLALLLMGSVTARVIGHSLFSILVVPRDATLGFQRILMAADDSPYSAAAWEAAMSLAKRMGSALIGVSVAATDAEIKTAMEVVAKMESQAAQQGITLETMVPRGKPYEAIVKAAELKQADLIILGSHGRTGLRRLLMGSVAERVIGQAPCAVLVVKKGREPV